MYSRDNISGPHGPILVKFGVFIILKYGHENAEIQKRKFDNAHFGTLFGSILIVYEIELRSYTIFEFHAFHACLRKFESKNSNFPMLYENRNEI